MATISDYSRTIPQRLQRTFAPVSDCAFDDVLGRLAAALDDKRVEPGPRPAWPLATSTQPASAPATDLTCA